MNSFSGQVLGKLEEGKGANPVLDRGSFAEVLMGKGKRSRPAVPDKQEPQEHKSQDSSLLSAEITRSPSALHKQRRKTARAARTAGAAGGELTFEEEAELRASALSQVHAAVPLCTTPAA